MNKLTKKLENINLLGDFDMRPGDEDTQEILPVLIWKFAIKVQAIQTELVLS